MKKSVLFLAGVLFIIFLSSCSVSLASDVTPPPNYQAPTEQESVISDTTAPILPPDIVEGKLIYQEKCQPCHGEGGLGDGIQSSQLPVPAAEIGKFDFSKDKNPSDWYKIITIGDIENFMPGFQSLNDRQRWNVTAYILTLSMQYDEAATKTLFKQNCESCHASGNSNQTSDFSDFGSLIDYSQTDISQIIQDGNTKGMPAFKGELSEIEINSLSNYIRILGVSSDQTSNQSEGSPSNQSGETPTNEEITKPSGSTFTIIGSITGLEEIPTDTVVTLSAFDTNNIIFQTEKTVSEDGSYDFPNLDLVTGQVYQLTTKVDGVEYSSEVLHNPEINSDGTVELPIQIIKTTTDNSSLFAERMHVFFDFVDENTIQVVELFVINNPTSETIIPRNDKESVIEYKIPDGAFNLQFEQGEFGTRYIETEKGFGDLQPIEANSTTQFLFAYELPYQKKLELTIDLPIPVEAAVFMLPSNSVKLNSDQLTFDGSRTVQGMDIQTYSSTSLSQLSELPISLTGKIKLTTKNEDNSTISIIIGSVVLFLAITIMIIWTRKRLKVQKTGTEEDSDDDLNALLDAVIALDDANKNGEIPGSAYQSRRVELIEKIKRLQGEK